MKYKRKITSFQINNGFTGSYYLPYSIKLIPFELGLRFLTDFLEGNVYFRTNNRLLNLFRAETQFRLVESIQKQWESLLDIINELRS